MVVPSRTSSFHRRVSRSISGSATKHSNGQGSILEEMSYLSSQSHFCLRCNRFLRRLWRDLKVKQPPSASVPGGGSTNPTCATAKQKINSSPLLFFVILIALVGFTGISIGFSGFLSFDIGSYGPDMGPNLRATKHYRKNHQNRKTHGTVFASSLPSILPEIIDPLELENINQQLKQMTLEQVLQWAYSAVGAAEINDVNGELSPPYPLVDVTSFGLSGMVVLHKLHQLQYTSSIPIITIDTLHLFPETYKFIERFRDGSAPYFTLPMLRVYQPKGYSSKDQFDNDFGADLYKSNPEKYGYISKVEPTLRALHDHQAKIWITGRRRSQGGERSNLKILEMDDSAIDPETHEHHQQRFKLNPLATWSYDDVWNYIREHSVPYNPLHDKGYKSIGDTMTTQPVGNGAGERSGRFVGMGQTECGIHSTRAKIKKMLEEAAAEKAKQNQPESGGILSRFFGGKSSKEAEETEEKQKNDENKGPSVPEPLPCSGCLELEPSTLVNHLKDGTTDFLIEFHSPLCGHCREFAPTYEKVAVELMHDATIQVARFDITYDDIPKAAQEMGLVVDMTPSLYFIRRLPEFKVIPFEGDSRTAEDILSWVKASSSASNH